MTDEQLTPLSESPYAELRAAGLITPATRSIRDLPELEAGEPVTPVPEAMRADQRN